jgi:hypothetical protein
MKMGWPVVPIAVAALAVSAVGCSVAASPSPEPSSIASSPLASRVASPSVASSRSSDAPPLVAAARAMLTEGSATFEHTIESIRSDRPPRLEASASGTVDPISDRGRMQYVFFPDDVPDDDVDLSTEIEIVWDATDYWAALPAASGETRRWTHTTRARARELALMGRVQEEPLALIRFAAEADPATIAALPGGELHGETVERWLVPIPIAKTEAAFVPPFTYSAMDRVFKVDALPLEVWLRDGVIVRVGYALSRDESVAGGPDRHETWYEWSGLGEPIDLELPPAGEIVEVGTSPSPSP